MQDVAMGDLGYDRSHADFYPTPAWVTEALIPFIGLHIDAQTPVWECACGSGEMAVVLREHFDTVNASDLHDYGFRPSSHDRDFLAFNVSGTVRTAIITNPPYGTLAEAFIRNAIRLTEPYGGVVAMLLRNEFDSAKTRIGLFNKAPFARKVVLTSRPRWVPDSNGSPRHNYAWFIWDWSWDKAPEISYALRGKLK